MTNLDDSIWNIYALPTWNAQADPLSFAPITKKLVYSTPEKNAYHLDSTTHMKEQQKTGPEKQSSKLVSPQEMRHSNILHVSYWCQHIYPNILICTNVPPKKETPKDGLLFSTILRFMHNHASNLIQRWFHTFHEVKILGNSHTTLYKSSINGPILWPVLL